MKKIFICLLAFGLLITCSSCSKETNEETDNEIEKEVVVDEFANIDELNPIDGTYKIHTVEGVRNIANHPDEKFELLCDVDCGGEVFSPIGSDSNPFSGSISGNAFTISNFTISNSVDGNLGFISNLTGSLSQLNLKDVTIISDDNAKNIGSLAGVNNGSIIHCETSAILDSKNVSENVNIGGAVGTNNLNISNSSVKLDIEDNSSNKMNIGGIAGISNEGKIRDSETHSNIIINNSNEKKIGLFVGECKDTEILRSAFMGEKNLVDGQLFEEFFGSIEGGRTTDLLRRDNSREELDPKIRELRNKVVQYMYDCGTIEWTTPVLIQTECVAGCSANVCHVALVPGTKYHGFPYKHSLSTLDRMKYCLDENNQLKTWVTDQGPLGGFQTYMGSDCYRSVQQAWTYAGCDTNAGNCMQAIQYPELANTYHIGNWSTTWENKLNDAYTSKCIDLCGDQAIFADYALMRAGDALIYINSGGAHCIMPCIDPVVVKDEEGNIDGDHSYIHFHDQGSAISSCEEFSSTWSIDVYRTFQELLAGGFLPVSCPELQTGNITTPEVHMKDDTNGILGLTTGIIESNKFIDSVDMFLTDAQGKEVYTKRMYNRIDKVTDYDGNVGMFERFFSNTFDMADFISPLKDVNLKVGNNTHAKIVARLNCGDEIVVKEFDF